MNVQLSATSRALSSREAHRPKRVMLWYIGLSWRSIQKALSFCARRCKVGAARVLFTSCGSCSSDGVGSPLRRAGLFFNFMRCVVQSKRPRLSCNAVSCTLRTRRVLRLERLYPRRASCHMVQILCIGSLQHGEAGRRLKSPALHYAGWR